MRKTSRLPKAVLGAGLTAAVITAGVILPATSAAAEGVILAEGSADAIAGSYIVVLKDGTAGVSAADLAGQFGGQVGYTYSSAMRGFSARMTPQQARRLAAHPSVSYVEQDREVKLLADQLNPPSWGLDRVDQDDLPLNQKYSYSTGASTVTAYIIDTGINYTHNDFGGRAAFGFDAFNDGQNGKDCQGHGTHVAGTVGGSTFGLAKQVRLKAVRVLNCSGGGSVSSMAAGVDWVTANASGPSVANMSLYTGVRNEPSRVLDDAVTASIDAGINYVVAAGNFNDNSCQYSPQRVARTINVGATNTSDSRASFSSYGTCTDIFAPGEGIISASHSSNTGSRSNSGTSMAAPHVAGAVALYLADNPGKTPAEVHSAIIANAVTGTLTNVGTGSPNRMLRVNLGGTPNPTVTVANPGARTGTVGTATSLTLTASGGTAPYSWSATGLPTGLSINAATGVVSGTPSAAGTYSVTATATASAGGSGSTTFSWTIGTTGGGCATQTNGTDVAIPDGGAAVTSAITVSGCTGNASSTSRVAVRTVHTYRGDLVIDLVAPDGSTYRLKNSSSSDSADNVDTTYTANLSGEARNGTWRLQVRDVYRADTGRIDTWSLTL